MNVALSPDEIARACADAMWKEDDASKGLGMKIVEVKPGFATLTMTVQPHMVNGQRIAHGGFIFLLEIRPSPLPATPATSVPSPRNATSPSSGRANSAMCWSRLHGKFRAAADPGFTMCASRLAMS